MIKICISTHYGVRQGTMLCLSQLQNSGVKFELQIGRGRDMSEVRNLLISPEDQTSCYPELPDKYSHYVMLDQDMEPNDMVLQEIISSSKPAVALAYPDVSDQRMACGWWKEVPGRCGTCMDVDKTPGYYSVDWALLGGLVVKRQVLETLPRPWYFPRTIMGMDMSNQEPRQVLEVIPPDIAFCVALAEHGVPLEVYVTAGILTKYTWMDGGLTPIGKRVSFSAGPEEVEKQTGIKRGPSVAAEHKDGGGSHYGSPTGPSA
jgi:hypothetical protein